MKKNTQLYFEHPSDSTLHEIALLSNQKFEETAKHFNSIQALLRPDQQEKFQKFKQRTVQHILGL